MLILESKQEVNEVKVDVYPLDTVGTIEDRIAFHFGIPFKYLYIDTIDPTRCINEDCRVSVISIRDDWGQWKDDGIGIIDTLKNYPNLTNIYKKLEPKEIIYGYILYKQLYFKTGHYGIYTPQLDDYDSLTLESMEDFRTIFTNKDDFKEGFSEYCKELLTEMARIERNVIKPTEYLRDINSIYTDNDIKML